MELIVIRITKAKSAALPPAQMRIIGGNGPNCQWDSSVQKEIMMHTNKLKNNLRAQVDKVFKHTRQGSYKTRERYRAAAYRFADYCADQFHLQKLSNISGKHLQQYIQFMQDEKNLSASTIKTELSGVRYLHDCFPVVKHPLPDNEHFDLERRQRRGKNRTWSNAEFASIVEAAMDKGRDDYVLALYLAFHMGLRIHEVFRIDTATARAALKTGSMEIVGKGGRHRCVLLDPAVVDSLRDRLKATPAGCKLLVKDEQDTHSAIKEMQQFVADNRKTDHTFHGLRHSAACNWYRKLRSEGKSHNAARKQISLWLGHSRLEIVDVYLSGLNKEELR